MAGAMQVHMASALRVLRSFHGENFAKCCSPNKRVMAGICFGEPDCEATRELQEIVTRASRSGLLSAGTRIMNFLFQTKGRGNQGTVTARKRILHCVVATLIAISFLILNHANCAAQSATEYQVKAAYLFNFLKFVEWPDVSPADPQAKWVIGIVGNSPIGVELSKLVESKNVLGRELQVKSFQSTDNFRGCNILFISESEKKRLPAILVALRGSSVMTVADMEHFIDAGGMVQFVVEDARVRVSIDVGATGRARLKVSSKLLALARTVTMDGSTKN